MTPGEKLGGFVDDHWIEYDGGYIFCDDFGTLTEEEIAELFDGSEDE